MRGLLAVVVAMALSAPSVRAGIMIETYTSRSAFEARLGNVTTVGFDDVATSGDAAVEIASDRYASQGIIINGQSSQYVSRTFSDALEYTPVSGPNMYAPGPIDESFGGGNQTDVLFQTPGGGTGAVAGFGAAFIDVDSDDLLNSIFPSSLNAFDADGNPRGAIDLEGGNAEAVFAGIITVDSGTGEPTPAIARVQLINGDGWPSGANNNGVPIDDMVFGTPATVTTTTTVVGSTTTSTLVECPTDPATTCVQSLQPGASRLYVYDNVNDLRDAFNWSWTRGEMDTAVVSQIASQDLFLCLYNPAGLRFAVTVPANASCGTRACWRGGKQRAVYRDNTQALHGIAQVVVSSGAPGKSQAKILWLGQGAKLLPPPPPLTLPVQVQMFSGGQCFEAIFSNEKKNAGGQFRARSD